MNDESYEPDRSWRGKLRRRVVRLRHRRPALRRPERPMVSFTFDDAPASSFEIGRAILDARGVKGAWFIAPGLCGTETHRGRLIHRSEVEQLVDGGHEIACHTYSHLDCGAAGGAAVRADFQRSADTFHAWGLPRPTTFAYPYGDVSAAAKRAAGERFALSRALHPGLIEPGADLNQAPSISLDGGDGEAIGRWWLDRAAHRPAWLILFAHHVGPEPSRFGVSSGALERLLDSALERGFEVVTVAEGARRVGGAG